MKQIFIFLFAFFAAGYTFAQSQVCYISGPAILNEGDLQTYSVSLPAQCSECFDWDVSGPAAIVGSDQNNTVKIQALGTGTVSLCATVFNENGCTQCCLSIEVGGCCQPTMDGDFSCLGTYGHGHVTIEFPATNYEKCVASVESVEWFIDNGELVTSTDWLNRAIKSQACIGTFIHVRAIVHYSNGCDNDTLDVYIPGACPCDGKPVEGKSVGMTTGSDGSALDVNVSADGILEDVEISVVDPVNGVILGTNRLEKLNEAGSTVKFGIEQKYKNKLLWVLARSNGQVLAKNVVYFD